MSTTLECKGLLRLRQNKKSRCRVTRLLCLLQHLLAPQISHQNLMLTLLLLKYLKTHLSACSVMETQTFTTMV